MTILDSNNLYVTKADIEEAIKEFLMAKGRTPSSTTQIKFDVENNYVVGANINIATCLNIKKDNYV